jgi:hypothetical protein
MIATRLAVILWMLLTGPAAAGAPFDGRWAADVSRCADDWLWGSPVTVTSLSVSWPGAYCVVSTSYLVRDVWHVSARCWGEGSVGNVPIKLQVRGDRLMFAWGPAQPEELRRCP